jgi:hypothetical protein
MSRQVTLELPDEVFDRAERLAALTRRDVKQLLAEAVSAMLPPLERQAAEGRPMRELSDSEVLRLADYRLSRKQERRLSQLLDQQQAEALTSPERAELLGLMQLYEVQWLQQAEALAEAVRRGLREPLAP